MARGSKHCLTCGYDLRGLPSPRCPECGRAFDPNDRGSFIHRRNSPAWMLKLALVSAAFMLGPYLLFAACYVIRLIGFARHPFYLFAALSCMFILPGAVMGGDVVLRTWELLRKTGGSHRRVLVISLAIAGGAIAIALAPILFLIFAVF